MMVIDDEQFDILRRIAERGRNASQPIGTDYGDSGQLDLWQHMLDELLRIKEQNHGVKTFNRCPICGWAIGLTCHGHRTPSHGGF